MPTPEFIDGGLKLLEAATVAVRDGNKKALKTAEPLAVLFSVPEETIALLGAIIEGGKVAPDEVEAVLAAQEHRNDIERMHAGNLAEMGIEPILLAKNRKSIRGGPLLPRIAGGKVSLAPSLRRTVMYHVNEVHRGGAREVVKLFKECSSLNEHAEALLFEASRQD